MIRCFFYFSYREEHFLVHGYFFYVFEMAHHLGFGRPLHSRKDPRHVSGGRSPYVYRREAGVEMGFGGHHRFPTLYLSKKIKDKQGLTFHHCPGFKELRQDHPEDEIAEAETKRLTKKEFNKQVEKYEEREKTIKQRRKKTRDPTIKEVKDLLRKAIKYHAEAVNKQIPSIYPILGPVNLDSDDEDGGGEKRGGLKMMNTKKELKRYER